MLASWQEQAGLGGPAGRVAKVRFPENPARKPPLRHASI